MKPTVHTPPNMIERIDTLWAVVSHDENGEGLCGANVPGMGWIALTTATENLVESFLLPKAREVATLTGKKLKLVKFTTRTEVEDIIPEGTGRG